MIPYPQIDPVIFHIGPIAPRWYGLMYLLGFLYIFRLLKKNARWLGFDPEKADSVLATMVFGLIICARLVYVIFYNLQGTLDGPWWEVFAVWHGGLAFHGGFLGAMLGGIWVSKQYNVRWLKLCDVVSMGAPVGLGLGRIANFINGELWGRRTDVAWGMIFPNGGPDPRHPSQLYESFLEGLVLFVILNLIWRRKPNVGVVSGAFMTLYACFRIAMEFFREPDAQVGYLWFGITMGQTLSAVMLIGGGTLLWHSLTRGIIHDTSLQVVKTKKNRA
jgi:phosphatidylglycerol:prolipoprotein diacylglycerol transferase